MIQMPPKISPEKDLANRIREFISSSTRLGKNWRIYFVDKALDHEPELRNRIFVILINGWADSIHNVNDRKQGLDREAKKLKNDTALYYLSCLSHYFDGVVDLLSIFSKQEMIFIQECRNQYVHGRSSNVFKKTQKCRYVDDTKLVTEAIPNEDYWDAFRKCGTISGTENVDATLEILRV